MGGSNDKENLVRLSPRLHFVAHWVLWKAFRNAKMANAFWTMACCNGERINSKTYDTVRAVASKAIADAKRGKTTSDRHKAIISAMMAGRVVSEETKKRISEAKKGKKFSLEHIAKLTVTKIGRKASEETKAKMSAAKKGKKPNNWKGHKIHPIVTPALPRNRLMGKPPALDGGILKEKQNGQ